MSTSSISHLHISGQQLFEIAMIFVSIIVIVRALTYDTLIDESESPPSEVADELRGVKATKWNRILLVCIALSFGVYSIWKLWKG
jgi:uncharacterized membrane protein